MKKDGGHRGNSLTSATDLINQTVQRAPCSSRCTDAPPCWICPQNTPCRDQQPPTPHLNRSCSTYVHLTCRICEDRRLLHMREIKLSKGKGRCGWCHVYPRRRKMRSFRLISPPWYRPSRAENLGDGRWVSLLEEKAVAHGAAVLRRG
jgi:hypothetical protein